MIQIAYILALECHYNLLKTIRKLNISLFAFARVFLSIFFEFFVYSQCLKKLLLWNIADSTAIKKLTYILSTPPVELIDSSNYTLNFAGRKFLNAELNPTDEYTIVPTTTPSWCVNIISPNFYNIYICVNWKYTLVHIRSTSKIKRTLILKTPIWKLLSMTYQGENILVT